MGPVHLHLELLREVSCHRVPVLSRGRGPVMALVLRQAFPDGQDVVHDDGVNALLDLSLVGPRLVSEFHWKHKGASWCYLTWTTDGLLFCVP